MAAQSSDLFMEVGLPGSATTLAGTGYTVGNTSITVATTTNHPVNTGYVFAIDKVTIVNGKEVRVDGSYCEFTGVRTSSTTIGSLVLSYGNPQNYPAGAMTRVYIPVSSTRENKLVQGMTAQHKQDGSHSVVTADTLSVSGNLVASGAISGFGPNKITNPYKFSAYLTASSVTGNNVYAKVLFDTESFDTGNNFDIMTNKGRFTAPIAGFYQFNAAVRTSQGSGTHRIVTALFKNGVPYTYGTDGQYSGGLWGSVVSDIIQLNANDYVEVYVYGDTTLNIDVGLPIAQNRFSGFLVSGS